MFCHRFDLRDFAQGARRRQTFPLVLKFKWEITLKNFVVVSSVIFTLSQVATIEANKASENDLKSELQSESPSILSRLNCEGILQKELVVSNVRCGGDSSVSNGKII